jgi:hypothetical protein
VFIRGSPSYFHVPHAFHELLFGEADFPGVFFLLKVRQVVAAVDIYGVELEVAGADEVLLEPLVQGVGGDAGN